MYHVSVYHHNSTSRCTTCGVAQILSTQVLLESLQQLRPRVPPSLHVDFSGEARYAFGLESSDPFAYAMSCGDSSHAPTMRLPGTRTA